MKKYLYIFLISLVVASCNSPLDIDTDRYKKPVDPQQVRIKPNLDDVDIEENGSHCGFDVKDFYLVVDTINSYPCYWLRLNLVKFPPPPPPRRDSVDRISILSMELMLDSAVFTGSPIRLSESKSYLKYKIRRGIGPENDTIVNVKGDAGYGEIFLNHNKRGKEIWAMLYSKVCDKKMWIEDVSKIIRDTIIKIHYDTIWVNNEMVIREKRDTIIKEKEIKVPEKRQARDSLSFRAKFRFKY